MVAKKDADANKAEDKAATDAAGDIELSVDGADAPDGAVDESDLVEGDLKQDGTVVGEEVAPNGVDRLIPVKTEQPTPGGPGDRDVLTKDEKAEAAALVVNAEVTSQNPEPYSEAEMFHRFSHIPPAGHEEHKITIQQ